MIKALCKASCDDRIFFQKEKSCFNFIQSLSMFLARTVIKSTFNLNESWSNNTWSEIFKEVICIKDIKKILYVFGSFISVFLRTSSCVNLAIRFQISALSLEIFWLTRFPKCLWKLWFFVVNALSIWKVSINLWFENALAFKALMRLQFFDSSKLKQTRIFLQVSESWNRCIDNFRLKIFHENEKKYDMNHETNV